MNPLGHRLLQSVLAIISGTRRSQRIIVFGVRRSGNHALTDWLTNAVDEAESSLTQVGEVPPLSHCFKTKTGSTVHLNEVNELDLRSTFKLFWKARKWTGHCKRLIISFEDVRPSSYKNFRRLAGHEVLIRRKPLEIISSRYHNINQKANQGVGWSRQSCDDYFMDTLREFMTASPAHGSIWDYNLWLQNKEWRISFLDGVNLSHDALPPHSSVGGGSSFHGMSGRLEDELSSRLRKVEPQGLWRQFLEHIMDHHPDLFSEEELVAARAFIAS